jgi:hypothetical protein
VIVGDGLDGPVARDGVRFGLFGRERDEFGDRVVVIEEVAEDFVSTLGAAGVGDGSGRSLAPRHAVSRLPLIAVIVSTVRFDVHTLFYESCYGLRDCIPPDDGDPSNIRIRPFYSSTIRNG